MSEVWDDGPTGAVGKRRSPDEPLTEHDVAERLSKAALRTWRILSEARQLGLMDQVKHSRYLPGGELRALREELDLWLTQQPKETVTHGEA